MSTLTILEFSPHIHWHHGGTTASLRIKYSANFTDGDGLPVLRGLYKDVPCTIVDGVLTVSQFTLITTNDALINPLATCTAQFFDSNGSARDWLFQNFSIPQVLIPATNIGGLFTYNQGSSLPGSTTQFYLSRDETTALVLSLIRALGLGPATQLALGIVRLRVAAADPGDPEVFGTNDPLVRDALTLLGIGLDATMASPADTNVPVFDAVSGTWKPGIGAQGAAGGALSGNYPDPSVVNDSHFHSVMTLVGLGVLAILDTVDTPQIDDDAVTADKLADTAVIPGSYTSTDLTVDAQGRITAAANGAAAGGSVTTVSVTSANGFAGSVADPTTTPAITISTTITGLLKGNGTAISAATPGTDYVSPTGTIVNATGSPLTLNSTHNGKTVLVDDDVTIPAGLGAGFNCLILQAGASAITFIPSGTTLNSVGGLLDTAGQWTGVSVLATASDVFALVGGLA